MRKRIISVVVVVALIGVAVYFGATKLFGQKTSEAARTPALAADPTGRPPHAQYQYPQQPYQDTLPGQAQVGPAAGVGPGPAPGAPYAPNGQPNPLGPLDGAARGGGTAVSGSTWTLYLSGVDQLQPNRSNVISASVQTGPLGGSACGGAGTAEWTAPSLKDRPFHGPFTGVLHVQSSGGVTLHISAVSSTAGGGCQVLASTSTGASGTVSFSTGSVNTTVAASANISLVVTATGGTATISTSASDPSYIVAPTPADV